MFQTTNQQINLDAPKFLVENQQKSSSKPLQTAAPVIQETDSPARPLSAPPPENASHIIRRVKCYISWWRFPTPET